MSPGKCRYTHAPFRVSLWLEYSLIVPDMSANQLISFRLITFWSYCVFQRKIDISFLGHYQTLILTL